MRQQTLASQASFEKYGRKTRRELFLEEMNQVVPWSELEALVEPHYPKAGNGRRPVGLGIMLRTYFVQQWFNLSDPGVEEALYDSTSLRRFVGVDLGVAPAPDETSVCRFRHLLEKHELGGAMLDAVNHPRTQLDEELDQGARPGDAPDQERKAMVLRSEGAYRCGQQRGRGAFGVHLGGQRGRRAYVTRLIARRRAQGMGRRRLSGADRSDPPGRAPRPGYDLPQDQVQELRG